MSWMIPGDIPETGDGYEREEGKSGWTLFVVKLAVVVGAVALAAILLDWVAFVPHR